MLNFSHKKFSFPIQLHILRHFSFQCFLVFELLLSCCWIIKKSHLGCFQGSLSVVGWCLGPGRKVAQQNFRLYLPIVNCYKESFESRGVCWAHSHRSCTSQMLWLPQCWNPPLIPLTICRITLRRRTFATESSSASQQPGVWRWVRSAR